MNFAQDTTEIQEILDIRKKSLKSSLSNDDFIISPLNKHEKADNKEKNVSNFSDMNLYLVNGINKNKETTYIPIIDNEESEDDDEINSDEYISSTNLDVETNTYINLKETPKDIQKEKIVKNSKNFKIN